MAHLQAVCEASPHLELSEDRAKVRRATPWPDQDTSRPRTVFCKGVPASASLDALLEYFGQFGAVNAVRFRRDANKERKNSIFVEFADEAVAKHVAQLKDQKYPGVEAALHFEPNAAYSRRKRTKKNQNDGGSASKKSQKGKRDERSALFEQGTVVGWTGAGGGLSRAALKELFEANAEEGTVRAVDCAAGASEGYVRLDNGVVAAFMIEKMRNDKVPIDGKVPELRILEGKEFEDYLSKMTLLEGIKTAPKKKKPKQKKNKNDGGEKGGKGKGKANKGKADAEEEESSNTNNKKE